MQKHSNQAKYDITIAVPTLNGEEFLEQLIQAVFAQESNYSYELLIIDSGSTDSTLEIIKKHKQIRLHEIPNVEFGHGKTRNLAAKISNSIYMVFLTQDAVPAHTNWLNSMIEPFELNPKILGVFGKQIPRANCSVTIKREVKTVFDSFGSDLSIMIQRKSPLIESLGLVDASGFFSDVNSAIRTDTLKHQIPFRDVKYSEDQAFGKDVIEKGFQKAYVPFGSVFHSNDYSAKDYFKRKFDEAYGLRLATGQAQRVSIKELLMGTFKATLLDWAFAIRDKEYSLPKKIKEMTKAPFYNYAVRSAIRKTSKSVSPEEKDRYSLEHKLQNRAKK